MNVRVLFFSVLQDITGLAEIDVEMEPGATLGELVQELQVRWPALTKWDKNLLLAVDQAYAKRETVLTENAEVAIMPPVQGG